MEREFLRPISPGQVRFPAGARSCLRNVRCSAIKQYEYPQSPFRSGSRPHTAGCNHATASFSGRSRSRTRGKSSPGHALSRALHRARIHVLCPVTGQPDFAHLVIDYAPGDWIVESKSLKLYLTSFRNHGAFHEDCTVSIGKRLVDTLSPTWLRIAGYWYPRGGMPIDVFWQTGKAPDALWVPDTGVAPYRGRG